MFSFRTAELVARLHFIVATVCCDFLDEKKGATEVSPSLPIVRLPKRIWQPDVFVYSVVTTFASPI